VIFETRDGGVTWRAAQGPPVSGMGYVLRLALPPNYPRDPRIFVGSVGGQVPGMVAERMGAAFVPLAMPPGQITIPPAFPSTATLYISTATAVFAFRTTDNVVQPLLFTPPLATSPTVVLPGDGSADLLVLGGSAVDAATGLAGDGRDAQGDPSLYRCGAALSCSPIARVPFPAGSALAVSKAYATDHALLLSSGSRLGISRDGGRSFADLPSPPGIVTHALLTAGAAGATTVWATIAGAHFASALERYDSVHGWRPVLDAGPPPAYLADAPTFLGTDRALVPHGGVLGCTADGGRHWNPRCPS
jgi:hypothetical protein